MPGDEKLAHYKNRVKKIESKLGEWKKMNPLIVRKEIDRLKTDVRVLKRKIKEAELREKQLIILLKNIANFVMKRNTAPTLNEIVNYISSLVQEHKRLIENDEDLIEEIINIEKSSQKEPNETIGIDEVKNEKG